MEYDAIVVGARVAGAPTAMLLARTGYRVLLVDRSTFPSDVISTHYIQPPGADALSRWGLLDRVLATGCPRLGSLRTTINGVDLDGPGADDSAFGLAPRRTVLDKLLVDAAREAGVEVREGVSVREIIRDSEHVTGICGRSAAGSDIEATARIVIGADGAGSVVAKAVQPEEYNVRPGLTCGFYSYWRTDPVVEQAELHIKSKKAVFVFPTNDGEVCIGTEQPADTFAELRRDPEAGLLAAVDTVSDVAGLLRAGTRTEKMFGMRVGPSFYRKPYGPGWALVGDAGYHKDPVTGAGITDAFRDAELLADAIDAGFSGRAPLDEALTGYEQQRNAATQIMYEVTAQLATLDPSPEFLRMIASGPPAAAAG